MGKFLQFIDVFRVGDLASILGLLISLVGFAVTLVGVRKSREAARGAEEAARRTRETMLSMQSIIDVSSVLAALEEIKRLHRAAAWSGLPERYATLRSRLVSLRASRPDLLASDQATIQGAIQQLNDLEKSADRAADSDRKANVAKLNGIISGLIDKLTELLARLQLENVSNDSKLNGNTRGATPQTHPRGAPNLGRDISG